MGSGLGALGEVGSEIDRWVTAEGHTMVMNVALALAVAPGLADGELIETRSGQGRGGFRLSRVQCGVSVRTGKWAAM